MKNIIKNCFNIVFIIIFGYILYNSIFKNIVNIFTWNEITITVGVIVNILLLVAFYEFIKNKEKINTKLIIPILLVVIFTFQCYIANLFKVSPNWDMRELFENAKLHLQGDQSYLPYLYRYNNNIGIQIIIISLFKISDIIRIIDYYDIAILFNIIMIDLALVFTYLVGKKLFDSKRAFIIFIILASMTPIYLYTPIIYTDTISMLFPPLILYLYIRAKEGNELNKKCILYSIMSMAICVGGSIKFTVIILPIAILIYEIINCKKDERKYYTNKLIIITVIAITIVTTIVIGVLTVKLLFTEWNLEECNKNKFPITHWVMMGLENCGKYNEKDVKYTSSFSSVKEKKEKNIEVIKERIKDININKIRNKLVYTWGDGSYYVPYTLDFDPLNEGFHQELIFKSGRYHVPYKYYTQIQHLTAITLMIIATIVSIRRKISNEFILRVSIFGLFLFLLIWEVRSRYIVNYLPIIQLAAYTGIEEMYNVTKKLCLFINSKNKKH